MPRERIVAGLMSGTSADGIDVALLRLGPGDEIAYIAGAEHPFDPALREHILACAESGGGDSRSIAALDFRLARAYAAALEATTAAAGLTPPDLDLIGCHGQTIAHRPGDDPPATLQAGSGPALAALTGVPVVFDFRAADVALGGQGAPLIPFVDWLLFRGAAAERPLGILNLGGIANITLLPRGISDPSQLLAFDTGPGNMLLDALATRLLGAPCDRDGRKAAAGAIHQGIVIDTLEHEFFLRPLPRSAGREEFGRAFAERFLERAIARGLSEEAIFASATAVTAESIVRGIQSAPASHQPREIVLGGGGARNPSIVEMLRIRLPGVTFTRHQDQGWPSDTKEAIGFALLADAAVRGIPAALPNVTGAAAPLVLGAIAPGRPPCVWPDWIGER